MTGVTGNWATCQVSGYLTSSLLFGGHKEKGWQLCTASTCIASASRRVAKKVWRFVLAESFGISRLTTDSYSPVLFQTLPFSHPTSKFLILHETPKTNLLSGFEFCEGRW